MQQRDKIVIEKMISEIEIGHGMLNGISLESFLADEKLMRATGMTIINVGELAKIISDEMRAEHGEVPWKGIAGMRDITAHRYQTLRMEDVYVTATKTFPEISGQLQSILDCSDPKQD